MDEQKANYDYNSKKVSDIFLWETLKFNIGFYVKRQSSLLNKQVKKLILALF